MKKILFILVLFLFISKTSDCAIVEVQTKTKLSGSDVVSHPITFTSTATADNLLYTCIAVDKDAGSFTVPAGFTLIHDYVGASVSVASAFKISTGVEDTLTWTLGNAHNASIIALEYSGLTASSIIDVKEENDSGESAVSTLDSGTTSSTTVAISLALACFGADSADNFQSITFSNSFVEVVKEISGGGVAGIIAAKKELSATGIQSTTASWTGSDQAGGNIAVFKTETGSGSSRRIMVTQ